MELPDKNLKSSEEGQGIEKKLEGNGIFLESDFEVKKIPEEMRRVSELEKVRNELGIEEEDLPVDFSDPQNKRVEEIKILHKNKFEAVKSSKKS